MDSDDQIAASVIVPCWNSSKFLRTGIVSILANSFRDFEVIAVDDASTDDTLAVLRRMSAEDPRIRVFRRDANGGISAARNTGLGHARGRYVFFLDPDDSFAPETIGRCVARLDTTGADFLIFPYSVKHPGETGFTFRPLREEYECHSSDEVRRRFLPRVLGYSIDHIRKWNRGAPLFSRVEMGSVCRCVYRRSVIEEHGVRFDETLPLSEDAMFNAEFAAVACSMTSLPESMYFYSMRKDGNLLSRDASSYMFLTKLRQLRRREEIDRKAGGTLSDAFAGSCVFALLEMLHLTRMGVAPAVESRRAIAGYAAEPTVRRALSRFPISLRHPLVAALVILLRARMHLPLHAFAHLLSRIIPRKTSRYAGLD